MDGIALGLSWAAALVGREGLGVCGSIGEFALARPFCSGSWLQSRPSQASSLELCYPLPGARCVSCASHQEEASPCWKLASGSYHDPLDNPPIEVVSLACVGMLLKGGRGP